MQTINFDEMTLNEISQHILDIYNGAEESDEETFRAYKQERMRRMDNDIKDENGVLDEQYQKLILQHAHNTWKNDDAVARLRHQQHLLPAELRPDCVYGYSVFKFPESEDETIQDLFNALLTIKLDPRTKLKEVMVRESFKVYKADFRKDPSSLPVGHSIGLTGIIKAFEPLKEKLFLSDFDITLLQYVRGFADTRKLGLGTIDR